MENENYQNAINLLTSTEKFHVCLGLERVARVLDLLGNPQESLQIIHVAGTNGKGSTSAILSKVFTCAGFKTGLYTSPHLLEYTERIKINDRDISQRDFADLIFDISALAKENDIYLTEFELLTVCAYKYFSNKETDICVIETGLGGRLDATNAINKNLLSVITSISLDHTDRLGDTIEKIAFEKAGVIKNDCPVMISPENKGFETIQTLALERNSRILTPQSKIELSFEKGKNYAIIDDKRYKFGLLGLWQKENLELAYEAIKYLQKEGFDIKEHAVKKGLEEIFWACRMQFVKKYNLLIDGTHNPDGARVLRESLDFYFPEKKRVWIYGALKNKDYEKVMKTLFRKEDEVYFFNFKSSNAASFEALNFCYQAGMPINKKELEYLITENKETLIVISGSFYMIGDIINYYSFLQNIAEVDNII